MSAMMPDIAEAQQPPLSLWAVSDGRAGIENQVLGLAEAVARLTPAVIAVKHLRYAGVFDRLPSALKILPDLMLAKDSDPVAPPWPDVWIAAGRATIPHSLRMRRRSNGRTLVVQLQDPKADHRAFDLIIAPEHDCIVGANTLSLLGSTNRITPQALADASISWRDRLEAFPRPHIVAAIGGLSRTHDLSATRAASLATQIKTAVAEAGGSLFLTLSRRTPEAARAIFRRILGDTPGVIYDGGGDNPYFAFLNTADHILVTEDSVNMATEAAVTGKPVHILAMDRLKPAGKFAHFHESLVRAGITRPFNGQFEAWRYTPLQESDRAARAVLQALEEKRVPGRVKA